MIMDIPETSLHTIPHDSHRGHTSTDEQQKNWIKDESLGYIGVEMWKGRLVWGGGMVVNILQYPGTIHVTIATTHYHPYLQGTTPHKRERSMGLHLFIHVHVSKGHSALLVLTLPHLT